MYRALRPLLFALPPEQAHELVFAGLERLQPWLARGLSAVTPPSPALAYPLGRLRLRGPVGLAAGLDKDGTLASFWPALGFGFVELGTVTPRAQPGNDRPRLFRVASQEALVNRMGFNNQGAAALADRLRQCPTHAAPIGVNVGKNKTTPEDGAADDYATATGLVAPFADYVVINVSSPNTPGLRRLQRPAELRRIVTATVAAAAGKPVFVKLSPDLDDSALLEAVHTAEEAGAEGFIATNTTLARPGVPDVGAGGLSGAPLHARALQVVATIRRATAAPLIGVGGVRSPATALAMLAAGADALQLYTGFIYEGPALVRQLNCAIGDAMAAAGVTTVPALSAWLRAGARSP